jgi:hypothetical protein
MAITVRITNEQAGSSYLYERPEQKGARKKAPTYRVFVSNSLGQEAEFLVTRDTVVNMFGAQRDFKYGTNDECPPNKKSKPYHGHIRTDGTKGFRIELYEPGIGLRGNNFQLKGTGKVIRENIQIHIGPGQSLGCFLLTSGTKGREQFKKIITKMSKGKEPEFRIYVQKR